MLSSNEQFFYKKCNIELILNKLYIIIIIIIININYIII